MNSITVVIPCFNARRTIAAAVESAIKQQEVSVQIICVDNNSQDGSDQLLTALAASGTIDHLTSDSATQGASFARNQGLAAATGEFIQFLDADDLLHHDKLSRQSAQMQANHTDVTVSAYRYRNIKGYESNHYPYHDVWNGLLASKLGRTSANLYRRSALIAVDGWSVQQKSSQEYQLMFKLLKNHAKVNFDDQLSCDIIATPGSISHTNLAQNAQRYIDLRQQMIGHLEQQQLITPCRQNTFNRGYEQAMRDIGG